MYLNLLGAGLSSPPPRLSVYINKYLTWTGKTWTTRTHPQLEVHCHYSLVFRGWRWFPHIVPLACWRRGGGVGVASVFETPADLRISSGVVCQGRWMTARAMIAPGMFPEFALCEACYTHMRVQHGLPPS